MKRYSKQSPERLFSADSTSYCDSVLNGNAIQVTEANHSYFESDSVRFFIATVNHQGSTRAEDSIYRANYMAQYAPLFLNGLITGKSLEAAHGESLIPYTEIVDSFGQRLPLAVHGYSGPCLSINSIEEFAIKSHKKRYFHIKVSIPQGLGPYIKAFYLELYNSKGRKSQSLEAFCKSAERSCLRYAYIEI